MEMLGYILYFIGVLVGYLLGNLIRAAFSTYKQLKKCSVDGTIRASVVIADDSKWYNPKFKVIPQEKVEK